MNVQFLINTAYTPEPGSLIVSNRRRTDVSLKTHAFAFLMHACGVNRLFDKTCVEEFLFRMGLILRNYNVVDDFFRQDLLLNDGFLGPDYALTVSDLKGHLGLEVSNSPFDFVSQDEWLKEFNVYWRNACLTCIFGNAPIIDRISKPIDDVQHEIIDLNVDVNDINYNNHVSIFVMEVIKTCGKEPFERLHGRVKERMEELNQISKKLNEKVPLHFDYMKIPGKIKERFFEVICGPVLKNAQFYQEVANDPTCNFAALVHLSWLWDNDFVKVNKISYGNKHSYSAEVDPRIKFNYDYYDGLHNLEFGVNLFLTYRDYNLEKLKGLLKEKQ